MQLYHAIRRPRSPSNVGGGGGLQGPVIFWEYGDVLPYLFPPLLVGVEYRPFDNILDAIEFINGSTNNDNDNNDDTDDEEEKNSTTTNDINNARWPYQTRVPPAAAAAAAGIQSPIPLPLRKRAPCSPPPSRNNKKPTTKMGRIQRGRTATTTTTTAAADDEFTTATTKDDTNHHHQRLTKSKIPTTKMGRIMNKRSYSSSSCNNNNNLPPPPEDDTHDDDDDDDTHPSSSSSCNKKQRTTTTTNAKQQQQQERKPRKPKISKEEYDAKFEKGLSDLKEFYRKHGHCNVPQVPRTPLYAFVDLQRMHYAYLKAGKETKLTPYRIQKLKELNFVFTYSHSKRTFDEMAVEWFEYQTTHNGDDPPFVRSGGDEKNANKRMNNLHQWVRRIRQRYQDFQQNGPGKSTSTLTQVQINKLTQWGFQWEKPTTTTKKSSSSSSPSYTTTAATAIATNTWKTRFDELVKYKQQHGHTIVSQKHPGGLGGWVCQQRLKYRRQQTGGDKEKKGSGDGLTSEKVQQLQDIGFAFEVSRGILPRALCGNPNDNIRPISNSVSSRYNTMWKTRFLELVHYKEQHGHTLVPQKHPGGLGFWVCSQRRKYKQHPVGERGGLTSDELQQLQNIGFAFEASPGPVPRRSTTKANGDNTNDNSTQEQQQQQRLDSTSSTLSETATKVATTTTKQQHST